MGTHVESCRVDGFKVDFDLDPVSRTDQTNHPAIVREAAVLADGESGGFAKSGKDVAQRRIFRTADINDVAGSQFGTRWVQEYMQCPALSRFTIQDLKRMEPEQVSPTSRSQECASIGAKLHIS